MKDYIKELYKVLGKGKVKEAREYLITHSYDGMRRKFLPDVVVFPDSTRDVVKIVNIASKYKIPITPRGAGTGMTGGALPVNQGILISFSKMNGIIKVSVDNTIAIVQPGVVTYDLVKEVERYGLFYPPDPASYKTSTIGGNVAENAGGPHCFKYGVTKNYVLGLEAVLINGEIIRTGGKTIKNVVGYNLTDLLIGSEGTLAIITEITLKLIPKPKFSGVARLGFRSLGEAVKGVNKIITNGFFPSALEFMDRVSIKEVFKFLGLEVSESISAYLILEFDGDREEVENQLKEIKALFSDDELEEIIYATDSEEKEKIWEIRRNISGAVSKPDLIKYNEDIVVPRSKLPEIVDFVYQLGKEYNVKTVLFGHIGDGNIHTNFFLKKEQEIFVDELLEKLFKKVVDLGGVLSGEHGIGIAKKRFISYQLSPEIVEIHRKIKRIFDPENLLNPGKIF